MIGCNKEVPCLRLSERGAGHPLSEDQTIDTDREIISELQHGKTARFRALVDRHKDKALTLAMRILGERQDAEEAVQDAFVKVHLNLSQFRGDSTFHTWFYRILYNECISRIRRRRNAPLLMSTEEHDEISIPDDDASADAHMLASDIQEVIQIEFEKLAAHYRTALTLFYLQELRYEEIAGVMDVPVGTVKSYLFRGKQLLRKRLEGYGQREAEVA